SNKAEDFARPLYARMRNAHIRVWFAPEEIKGGQKLYEQIEKAIVFAGFWLRSGSICAQNCAQNLRRTSLNNSRHVEQPGTSLKVFTASYGGNLETCDVSWILAIPIETQSLRRRLTNKGPRALIIIQMV